MALALGREAGGKDWAAAAGDVAAPRPMSPQLAAREWARRRAGASWMGVLISLLCSRVPEAWALLGAAAPQPGSRL